MQRRGLVAHGAGSRALTGADLLGQRLTEFADDDGEAHGLPPTVHAQATPAAFRPALPTVSRSMLTV